MKVCTGCRVEKPHAEFHKRRDAKDGLASRCKACRNEHNRNTPRDLEAARASNRRWREANPEKARAASLRWYHANRDYAAECQREWHTNNPMRVKQYRAMRRAMIRAALVGDVDYARLLADFTDCYLCGRQLDGDVHLDHIVPLTRDGAHSMANLRPTHAGCNMRKYNHLLSELPWYHGPVGLGATVTALKGTT